MSADVRNQLMQMGTWSFEQAKEHIRFCNSHSRLPTLLELSFYMQDEDWLRLLGREWSGCDNISEYKDDLLCDSPFGWHREGTIAEMMDDEEVAAYNALPDVVTVYRGCGKENKWGLCWTLSKEVAENFPSLNRYRPKGQALLITAQVKKSEVIAVKLDRNECEVITVRPKHISTRHIKLDPCRHA